MKRPLGETIFSETALALVTVAITSVDNIMKYECILGNTFIMFVQLFLINVTFCMSFVQFSIYVANYLLMTHLVM